MNNLIINLIRLYQKFPFRKHNICRYNPTCSEYTILAIKKYGIVKGLFLGLKKILRCNPLGSYGYDPVPERKQKK